MFDENMRYQAISAKISQRYDSQIDGYHVISERSIEETLGNMESKKHLTLDSIQSIKDIKTDLNKGNDDLSQISE